MKSPLIIVWLLAMLLTSGYVSAQESAVSTDIPPIPDCAADLTVAAMNITTNIDDETATRQAIVYPSGGSPFVIDEGQGNLGILDYKFSPDGRYIMSRRFPLQVFDVQTGEEIATLDVGAGVGQTAQYWLPSGHLLSIEYAVSDVAYMWDPETNLLTSIPGDLSSDADLNVRLLSRDVYGTYLPYVRRELIPANDDSPREIISWYLYDVATNESQQILSQTYPAYSPPYLQIDWSSTGRYAVLQMINGSSFEILATYLLDVSSFTVDELNIAGSVQQWLMDDSGLLYMDGSSRMMHYDLATASSDIFYESADGLTVRPVLVMQDEVWLQTYRTFTDENEYTIVSVAPDGTVLRTIIEEVVTTPNTVRLSPSGEAIVFHNRQTDSLIVRRTGEDNLSSLEGGLMPEWVDDDLLLYHRQVNNQPHFSLFDVATEENCDLGEDFMNVKIALPAAGS